MSTEQNPTFDGLEVRPVGDELIVFDLETNETHLLSSQGVEAFQRAGVNRRTLLKTGATAGAVLAAGAVQTILAPPAAANSSGSKIISGSGTCPNGSKNVTVSITGDGFLAGSVSLSLPYPQGQGGSPTTVTATGTATQPKTGSLSTTLNLTNVHNGTTSLTITATDASGTPVTGTVTLTAC